MKDEIPYSAGFAEIYDDAYREKPYDDEVAFLDAVANPSGMRGLRVLDLSCGTGSHLEAFRRRGWECCGVDLSGAMVGIAGNRHPGIEFLVGDMRSWPLPPEREGSFDLCVSLFDSIGYAVTNRGVIAAMETARRALRKGGWFAFEVWSAAKFLRNAAPARKRIFEDSKGRRVIRLSETETDAVRMSAEVKFTFFVEGESGYTVFEESHLNRFFGVPEIELLLSAAGWTAEPRHFGDYSGGPVDGDSWHLVTMVENV